MTSKPRARKGAAPRRVIDGVQMCTLDGRGSVVIPARIRKQMGLQPGTILIFGVESGAVTLRPAELVPVTPKTSPNGEDDQPA